MSTNPPSLPANWGPRPNGRSIHSLIKPLYDWVGRAAGTIGDLESRSGTSVAGVVQTFADLPNPVERDGKAYYVVTPREDTDDPSPAMWVSNGTPDWFGPIDVRGAATAAAVIAAVAEVPVRAAVAEVAAERVTAEVGELVTAHGLGSPLISSAAAIQSAIDAAWGKGGGVARLPADGRIIDITPAALGRAITARPGVTLTGKATLRVTSGAPAYEAIIGHALADNVSGFHLDGVTIDQNGIGSPAPAEIDWRGDGRDAQYILFIQRGRDIKVTDCTFLNIDGINTLSFNGSAGAGTLAMVNGVHVTGCTFRDVGGSKIHDHSTIYTHAETVTIAHNHFYGRTLTGGPSPSAICAIETHGSGTRITDNHIECYREGINATGIAHRTAGVVVADNTLLRVLRGCRVFSQRPTGEPNEVMLRSVSIADNTIVLDVDWWAQIYPLAPFGVGFIQTGTAATIGLAIRDNTIEFLPYTGTSTTVAQVQACGIMLNHSGSASAWTVGVVITDNLVIGALACPIAAFGGWKIRGLTVTDNQAVNWGHASVLPDYTSGLFLNGAFLNAQVKGNNLADHTGLGLRGITWLATDASVNGQIVDNPVALSAAANVGARDLTITGAGAPFVRHRYRTGTALPTGACEVGSEITYISTGTRRTQTVAPSGTTWSTAAVT